MMSLSMAASPTPVVLTHVAPGEERETKRRRQAVATGSLAKRYRSRAAQAKPKKRPNRNLISKRVRRKHRRAA